MIEAETAFAKINLTLSVRHRRSDGYHDIDTVFAFADSGDTVAARTASRITLAMDGPFAAGLSDTDNLVIRAAETLRSHSGYTGGAEMKLTKQLPVASGIGGGSADAAATLRLLNRLWRLDLPVATLAEISAPLGADIPACVYSRPVRGMGTGTQMQVMEQVSIAGMPLLLVNPLIAVPTAEIFARWNGVDGGAVGECSAMAAARSGSNSLEPAAISLCQPIAGILSQLRQSDCIAARMSGSGATCFGLYENVAARDKAALQIHRVFPDYWTLACAVR